MNMRRILSAAVVASLFLGCPNPTFFEQIEQETRLEPAVISGAVNSVVKLNSKLYASDGNLYTKDEGVVRSWEKIDGPGGTITKLAADSTNLYALTEDNSLHHSTDATSWTKVDTASIGTIQTIFWDGASSPTAYLKTKSGSFYKLSGGTAPSTEPSVTSTILLKTDTGTYTASNSTAENNTTKGTVTGKASSGGETDLGSVSDLGTVYSLTYSAVDSALYAGTSKGLRKLPLDNSTGKLTGTSEDPSGNWGPTIKNHQSFAVLATGNTKDDAALYSSTIAAGNNNVKVNGLWGYYYNRRDNWNQE